MMNGPNKYEEQILRNQAAIMVALSSIMTVIQSKITEDALDRMIRCIDQTLPLLGADLEADNGRN